MFKNRTHAGQQLALVLNDHDTEADTVLAIPRGGLPIGRVVANSLQIPLDIVSARKIGAPQNPELAVGAVASDGKIKNAGADRVILAVPVAPPDTVEMLRSEADEVICVVSPPHFGSVGQFYESFQQVSDERAKAYLDRSDE